MSFNISRQSFSLLSRTVAVSIFLSEFMNFHSIIKPFIFVMIVN